MCLNLCDTDRLNGLFQHLVVNTAQSGYATGRAISGLLDHMAHVALRPFPLNVGELGGVVQAFPPLEVGLSLEPATHGFHYIAGVGEEMDVTRLSQTTQTQLGRSDFGLLVSSST